MKHIQICPGNHPLRQGDGQINLHDQLPPRGIHAHRRGALTDDISPSSNWPAVTRSTPKAAASAADSIGSAAINRNPNPSSDARTTRPICPNPKQAKYGFIEPFHRFGRLSCHHFSAQDRTIHHRQPAQNCQGRCRRLICHFIGAVVRHIALPKAMRPRRGEVDIVVNNPVGNDGCPRLHRCRSRRLKGRKLHQGDICPRHLCCDFFG